ncbi:primosomal protein N'' [Paenibacillus jamilae]|jgi:primosomal protein N''|nr:primosomal protein N'' [Paenibacillus jamilae]
MTDDFNAQLAEHLRQQVASLEHALAYKQRDIEDYGRRLAEARSALVKLEKRMGEMRY